MIKQHRTIYKTIKSRAETFVGCMFDEIARRLWSRHLHHRDAALTRYIEREKKELVPASAARMLNAFL